MVSLAIAADHLLSALCAAGLGEATNLIFKPSPPAPPIRSDCPSHTRRSAILDTSHASRRKLEQTTRPTVQGPFIGQRPLSFNLSGHSPGEPLLPLWRLGTARSPRRDHGSLCDPRECDQITLLEGGALRKALAQRSLAEALGWGSPNTAPKTRASAGPLARGFVGAEPRLSPAQKALSWRVMRRPVRMCWRHVREWRSFGGG